MKTLQKVMLRFVTENVHVTKIYENVTKSVTLFVNKCDVVEWWNIYIYIYTRGV